MNSCRVGRGLFPSYACTFEQALRLLISRFHRTRIGLDYKVGFLHTSFLHGQIGFETAIPWGVFPLRPIATAIGSSNTGWGKMFAMAPGWSAAYPPEVLPESPPS